MKNLKESLRNVKQRLCRHEWNEAVYLNAWIGKDGWLERVQVRRCRKCGKVVKA